MHENTKLHRGAPTQVDIHEWRSSTQEDSHWYQGQRTQKFRCASV